MKARVLGRVGPVSVKSFEQDETGIALELLVSIPKFLALISTKDLLAEIERRKPVKGPD
jgi:hypothetical protein